MVRRILKGISFGIALAAMMLLLVYIFQYIWNITVPDVFGLKSITYTQALGLLIISRILLGGFGFRWMNAGDKGKFWRERLRMKTQNMTEDEKAEFKRKLWQKCRD